jgi:hypothetical protein
MYRNSSPFRGSYFDEDTDTDFGKTSVLWKTGD